MFFTAYCAPPKSTPLRPRVPGARLKPFVPVAAFAPSPASHSPRPYILCLLPWLTLYKHVASCQQLHGLQRGPVWPNQALPPLDKLLLVSDQVADFDDVRLHLILQHLQGLHAGGIAQQQVHMGKDGLIGVCFCTTCLTDGWPCNSLRNSLFPHVE